MNTQPENESGALPWILSLFAIGVAGVLGYKSYKKYKEQKTTNNTPEEYLKNAQSVFDDMRNDGYGEQNPVNTTVPNISPTPVPTNKTADSTPNIITPNSGSDSGSNTDLNTTATVNSNKVATTQTEADTKQKQPEVSEAEKREANYQAKCAELGVETLTSSQREKLKQLYEGKTKNEDDFVNSQISRYYSFYITNGNEDQARELLLADFNMGLGIELPDPDATLKKFVQQWSEYHKSKQSGNYSNRFANKGGIVTSAELLELQARKLFLDRIITTSDPRFTREGGVLYNCVYMNNAWKNWTIDQKMEKVKTVLEATEKVTDESQRYRSFIMLENDLRNYFGTH